MDSPLSNAGSNAECIDTLSEWQKAMREYERISGKESDETVKTATPTSDVLTKEVIKTRWVSKNKMKLSKHDLSLTSTRGKTTAMSSMQERQLQLRSI